MDEDLLFIDDVARMLKIKPSTWRTYNSRASTSCPPPAPVDTVLVDGAWRPRWRRKSIMDWEESRKSRARSRGHSSDGGPIRLTKPQEKLLQDVVDGRVTRRALGSPLHAYSNGICVDKPYRTLRRLKFVELAERDVGGRNVKVVATRAGLTWLAEHGRA